MSYQCSGIFRKPRWLSLLVLAFLVLGFAEAHAIDAAKVMGPDECGECHKDEVTVWRETKHYKNFYELSRMKEAKQIQKSLGIKRIKTSELCTQCHFTSHIKDGQEKVFAGVTCESCHSAAREWIKVHSDYGGKKVKKHQETAEHKKARLQKMEAAGMIRPKDIYNLARNCYQCHTVPQEKLVNTGGHAAGSKFELVAWSQGGIRHNFIRSEDGKVNMQSSAERLRLLYVIGQALDLEYSLRGLAKATNKDKYAVSMAKRVKQAAINVNKINKKQPVKELGEMLKTVKSVKLKLNNEQQLLAAADKVAKLARQIEQQYDGTRWAALDSLLPSPDQYKKN